MLLYSPRIVHRAVRGCPSFHGRQSSSIVLMQLSYVLALIRDATVQGRQPALGGFPKFFPWCGAAVSGMNPQLPHRRRVYIGTGRCSGHLGVSLFIIGIKSSDGSNVGILLKMLTFDDQDATCLKFCLSFYRYSPSPVQISTLSNTTPEESWNRLE